MREHEYWPRRLRERPPVWPRRNEEDEPGPHPWERDPEPFEEGGVPELYPGGLVLDDLVVTEDELSSLRILARYTVIRVVLLSAAGVLRGPKLRLERRIALEHLALLPQHDWERRALERLAGACRERPTSQIMDALVIAAEAAAKRSQPMGSFALYRTAYELAVPRGWWAAGARAARGIERLARMEEARWSTRLWGRRAAVLERRAHRLTQAADG